MEVDNVLNAAKNQEWDKLKVHLSSIASRTDGSLLGILESASLIPVLPGPSLAESTDHPGAPLPMVQ